MKTYTFKPEFEEKLKRLRIKGKFIRNIKNGSGKAWIRRCKMCEETLSWYGFIVGAFVWVKTAEGQHFWSNIASHD